MFSLQIHSCADRLRSSGNDPLLIFPGGFEQEIVEFFPAAGLRHGHQVVPAKVAAFTFHAALFMPLSRRAKLRRETPMGAKGDKSCGLLSLVPPENLLHCTFKVVVP